MTKPTPRPAGPQPAAPKPAAQPTNTTVIVDEDGFQVAVIPLSRPVVHAGATVAELRVREPHIGAQVDGYQEGAGVAANELAFAAALAGVEVAVMRRLHPQDYVNVRAVMENFPYLPAPGCGAAPSSSPA